LSRLDFRPLVAELTPPPEPAAAFARLARRPHCLFLDSAMPDAALGRFSFLAADPFDWLELPADAGDCLGELARRMAGFTSQALPGLPPFQGGAAGLLGYELGHQLETLPAAAVDEFQCPALAIGLYDVLVAWDHVESRSWIVSQGFPEVEPEARRRRAARRLAEVRDWLREPPGRGPTPAAAGRLPAVTRDELAPQHAIAGRPGLTSDFSADQYLAAVGRVIDYISAGDAFQVNLSQRLVSPAGDDPVSLYLRLRRCNPAPFAGYFDLGEFQIVSASPERFLKVADRRVETRPIKGTRPRSERPEDDAAAERELLASEKDRAENVMIVDLLRNDLSRVCEPESVKVTQLCRVETYQYVKHLVSAVEGKLRDGSSPIDLVRASFPGGSVTGAPKVRAMEIIAELEPTARGPYCGSLGYLGFDGSMDLSILIRTITAGRGWWQLPAGGGIVAQSDPRREYEETWHKAEGMIQALT
jgi:para-aminobenzoate synthetase component 1